jgi:hypothetical protein
MLLVVLDFVGLLVIPLLVRFLRCFILFSLLAVKFLVSLLLLSCLLQSFLVITLVGLIYHLCFRSE